MKLLYATSASYPSTLANRLQTLAMAKEFHELLGSDFCLGVSSFPQPQPDLPIVEMPGSRRSILLAIRYALFIRRERFTHVYCREEKLLFFLRLYTRLLNIRVKLYFEAHTIRPDFIFKTAVRRADGVVAITHGVASDLMQLGVPPARIAVEADGVDLARFAGLPSRDSVRARFGIAQESKVLLYAGSFGFIPPWDYHPWKGADTFLDAASRAPADWVFVCAGGEDKEVVAVRERYPDTRIHLLGHVSPNDIPGLLGAANILVLPNKRGAAGSERYTSPLKLFEYMASGIPILASDLPSLREVVSEQEVSFFEPNDPEALISVARGVFENGDAAKERAARARSLADRYTWHARAERILSFLSAKRDS